MNYSQTYTFNNLNEIKLQILQWANKFPIVFYLDSNNYELDKYAQYELLVGITLKKTTTNCLTTCKKSFKKLKDFTKNNENKWLFGVLSYDLKNETSTNLSSNNFDGFKNKNIFFTAPNILLFIQKNTQQLCIQSDEEINITSILNNFVNKNTKINSAVNLQARISKTEYLHKFKHIQQQIQRGNIYEMNLCMEFYANNVAIKTVPTFLKLNANTQAPFASFVKMGHQYIMSASPERFLQKQNQVLVSQPIKGTIKRDRNNEAADAELKKVLQNSPKERSENVMIVDLVRNDLSRTCAAGSVQVPELFGVYTFKTVHHLISTIKGNLNNGVHFLDAISNSFPPGSMTGAPKIKAMQVIENMEATKRGFYSGSIGYITNQQNFDFNVIIRTIIYHAQKKYLSIQVGSAITANAVAEQEYEECLLKLQALKNALS